MSESRWRADAPLLAYPTGLAFGQRIVRESEAKEASLLPHLNVPEEDLCARWLSVFARQYGARADLVPSFTPGVAPKSSWTKTMGGVQDGFGRLADFSRSVLASGEVNEYPGLAELELNQISKACYQGGAVAGWDLMLRDDLSTQDVAPQLARAMEVWLGFLSARVSADEKLKAYPRGTNHGYPTFSKGDKDLLAHAVMSAAPTTRETIELLHATAEMLGARPLSQDKSVTTLFSRTYHTNKFLTKWDFSIAAEPTSNSEWKGVCARRRIVYGVSSALNMRLRHCYARLKSALVTVPFCYHGHHDTVLRKVAALSSITEHAFSDDISGFDTTNSWQIKSLCFDLMEKYGFIDAEEKACLEAIENGCVVGGPTVAQYAVAVYDKKDGLNSGNLLTSVIGNVLNCARVLAIVADLTSCTPEEALSSLGKRWGMLIWGDDTVIFGPREWEDQWAEAGLRTGYVSSVDQGIVFLMKYYDPKAGIWFPLASRFMIQTMFREHAPSNDAVEVLGLIARSEGLRRHPLGSRAWDLTLRESELQRDYSIFGDADAETALQVPSMHAKLLSLAKDSRGLDAESIGRILLYSPGLSPFVRRQLVARLGTMFDQDPVATVQERFLLDTREHRLAAVKQLLKVVTEDEEQQKEARKTWDHSQPVEVLQYHS